MRSSASSLVGAAAWPSPPARAARPRRQTPASSDNATVPSVRSFCNVYAATRDETFETRILF